MHQFWLVQCNLQSPVQRPWTQNQDNIRTQSVNSQAPAEYHQMQLPRLHAQGIRDCADLFDIINNTNIFTQIFRAIYCNFVVSLGQTATWNFLKEKFSSYFTCKLYHDPASKLQIGITPFPSI